MRYASMIAVMGTIFCSGCGGKGDAGPSGPTGATGATGTAGTTGPTGALGQAGPAGQAGAAGLMGPSGALGATGATGATGSSALSWVNVTDSSTDAAWNTGYVASNAGQVVVTLPTAADPGDIGKTVRVVGAGAGGWKVAQRASQQISTSVLPNFDFITWTPHETDKVWRAVASSWDGQNLVAVVDNGKIYTSSNYGTNWMERATDKRWYTVASSADGKRLIAGVHDVPAIYLSVDGGGIWNWAWAPLSVMVSVASSADGKVLLAAAQSGLLLSNDYGSMMSWSSTGPTLAVNTSWKSVALSSDGKRIIAGSANETTGRVYTSEDSGANWVEHLPSGPCLTGYGGCVWNVVASSADGQKLVAAVGSNYSGHIYTSDNFGLTWTERTGAGSHEWQSIAMSADGDKIVAIGDRIYTSMDFGATWTLRGPILPQGSYISVASSADGRRLIAAASSEKLYTSEPATATTAGTLGWLEGDQNAAVELQYIGGNQFRISSFVGDMISF